MVQALNGFRVLDLSRILAGPFCAMTLGDLGPRSSRSNGRAAGMTPGPGGRRLRVGKVRITSAPTAIKKVSPLISSLMPEKS